MVSDRKSQMQRDVVLIKKNLRRRSHISAQRWTQVRVKSQMKQFATITLATIGMKETNGINMFSLQNST